MTSVTVEITQDPHVAVLTFSGDTQRQALEGARGVCQEIAPKLQGAAIWPPVPHGKISQDGPFLCQVKISLKAGDTEADALLNQVPVVQG